MRNSVLSLLTLLWCVFPSLSYALEVQSVRFGVYNDKIRVVLDVDKVSDFRAFILTEPYRLIIDLPTFTWPGNKIERPPETRITGIRKGELSPQISRIVFDLNQPTIIQSAFMLPKQKGKKNRLVVDYKFTSHANFTNHKDQIHGNLKIPKTLTTTSSSTSNIPHPSQKPAAYADIKKEKPLIVIDPGHGGVDPGAIGYNKVYEKNVVLALSKELKNQLINTGKYRVIMTRDKDVFVRLKDRVSLARKHNADLFISIHADSVARQNVRGTSIYTLSKKASDAQTAKLAEKENQADLIAGIDLNIEDEQVAFILGDFLINETQNQSKFLANTIVKKIENKKIRTLKTPHRFAGFAVLKAPDIPSVLIETGFMSNKAEADLLNKPAHRKKIAQAIRIGIDAYFQNAEFNNNN